MAIALPGRTRSSNRRRVTGSSSATLQAGQISASPASPNTSQALVARPSPTYSTERPVGSTAGRAGSGVCGSNLASGPKVRAVSPLGVRVSRW